MPVFHVSMDLMELFLKLERREKILGGEVGQHCFNVLLCLDDHDAQLLAICPSNDKVLHQGCWVLDDHQNQVNI